jgi:hypothetical protein
MLDLTTTELIGYIGSLLVLLSFLMKDMRKLRIGNIIGSGTFIVYGMMLHSVPIIITNTSIVIINAYYLVKENKSA